ncbi:MAG: contractile injection system protein, VgrG/Pvc8 family [Bacteroidota bacterium]|nr:contractile injection system protein, VgrG/Pvc8 family [Bacteroidota bacterium]
MAQRVKTKLELESGKKIVHFKDLVVYQDLFRHHRFEITVPFSELEKKDEIFFQHSHKDVCGKTLSVSFESEAKKASFDFRFKGVVTEIILSNQSDFSSVFILKGYSPTLLLEDCSQRRTFIGKNLQQIFETVLKDYPGNVIKKKLHPRNKNTIPYTVQYDETNFAFISRLAAEYGEWFYYDGREIVLGSSQGEKDVDFLIDGNQSFDMSISLMPAKFNMTGYDYIMDQSYKGKSSGQPVDGLGQFSRFALDESENLFSQEALLISGKPVYNQNELDDLIKFRRSGIASNLVVFHGRGENPDLMVGSVISVSATRPEKGGRGSQESVGKYRITEITHTVDNNGNYANVFKAVPETAKFPPVNAFIIHPAGQPELATVTDNNDPDKLSRVKVAFNWPGDNKESPWIRVGSFYTGGEDHKGMQFIPEKESQVVVGYEMDKPEMPFIMTSLYPKKEGMRSRKGNNDEKAFYTKAGNLIELSDKQGENRIQITNVNKGDTALTIEFKDNGAITLKTNGKVNIEAQENISISAKQKLSLEAQEIEIKAQNKVSVNGTSISIEADTTAEMKANASAKLSSANTEVSGDAMTTIKGGLVKIN